MDLSVIYDRYNIIPSSDTLFTSFGDGMYYFWDVSSDKTQLALRTLTNKQMNQYDEDVLNVSDFIFAKQYIYDVNTTIVDIDYDYFPTSENISMIEKFDFDTDIFLFTKEESGYYIYYYDFVNNKSGIISLPDTINTIKKLKVNYYDDSYHISIVYIDDVGDLLFSPNNKQTLSYTDNDILVESNDVVLEASTPITTENCQFNDKNLVIFDDNNDNVTLYYNKYFIDIDYDSILFDEVETIKKTLDISTYRDFINKIDNDIKLTDNELIVFQPIENLIDGVEDSVVENSLSFGSKRFSLYGILTDDLTPVIEIGATSYLKYDIDNYTDFRIVYLDEDQFVSNNSKVLLISSEDMLMYDYVKGEYDYKNIDTSTMLLDNLTSYLVNDYIVFNNNFIKFEYLMEDDYNTNIVFVNMLRFLPDWFQDSTPLTALVDIFEKIYNDGMRIPDRNYDFLDVALDYKEMFKTDDRLYYMFKENPDIFFYNKNNTEFGGGVYEKFERLKDNNSVELVDDEYLTLLLHDLGLDWIYDKDFFDNLKKSYQLDGDKLRPNYTNQNPTDDYEFISNQASEIEVYKNNLDLYTNLPTEEIRSILKMILNNRWMIHSKSFYKMMVYILGFMYELKFLFQGGKNLYNINTGEINDELKDNFNNKVYITIDMEDITENTNQIINSINYIIKIIKKTLPINLMFSGVVFEFSKKTCRLSNEFKSTYIEVITNKE